MSLGDFYRPPHPSIIVPYPIQLNPDDVIWRGIGAWHQCMHEACSEDGPTHGAQRTCGSCTCPEYVDAGIAIGSVCLNCWHVFGAHRRRVQLAYKYGPDRTAGIPA